MTELRRRHWTLHIYGDRSAPTLVAAVFEWKREPCTDVVLLRGHDRAIAYRLPMFDNADPFAPEWVHWWWAQSDQPNAAVWAIRAALTLDPPAPDDATRLYTAPPFRRLAPDEHRQRPVVIRPL